jgi:hypothetical protein
MIKKLILSICTVTLLFISCTEEFEPFGEFRENYVFTCILSGDTTYQVATLSHNYKTDSFDPYDNTTDPSITGADLLVWLGDSVYVFRDTSATRDDTSRYNTPFKFYYNNRFFINANQNIEVEVLLENGRRLKSSSKTPGSINFEDESSVIIPPVGSDLVNFSWRPHTAGTFLAPKFYVRYLQNVGGIIVEKKKLVPTKYVNISGLLQPVYPEPSNKSSIIYTLDAVTRALEEISDGDVNKQNYTILQTPLFKLSALDLSLSRYVSSTNQSFDDLTVTVNESDFTNIDGGLGIFGSFISKNYEQIKFQSSYIESFGYKFLLND